MTQFIQKIAYFKKTQFNKMLTGDFEICDRKADPYDYDVVKFIKHDADYGDMFLAWSDLSPEDSILFFGEKGGEVYKDGEYLQKPERKTEPTVFHKVLYSDLTLNSSRFAPLDFNYVEYLGKSTRYGDMFKAWKEGEEENFYLYVGIAGKEFNI